MQAIQTRYLGLSNVRGSRIKAWCDRGSVTIPYPHHANQGEEAHREAAKALIAKFNKEDAAQFGEQSIEPGRGWNTEFASGGLPGGDYAHVFIDRK